MLISNEKKVVKIGSVELSSKFQEYRTSGFYYVVADDYMIDRLYDMYTQYKKLGRRKIAFDRFCINYFKGDYNYSIRQGWEKYE